MDNSFTSTTDSIFREQVVGSRRLSNYWWATVLFFGALCFFTVGLSSYLGFNILPFLNAEEIIFFISSFALLEIPKSSSELEAEL